MTTALLGVVVLFVGRKQERPQKTRFEPREVLKAIPAVAMPVLVVGGIYSGTLTVSETAAALLAYVIVYCLLFVVEQRARSSAASSMAASSPG